MSSHQSFQSIQEAERDRICRKLYPRECIRQSKCEYFRDLPALVSERIHSMRQVADLILTSDQVSEILGFGQSEGKDRILNVAVRIHDAPNSGLQSLLYRHPLWSTLVAFVNDMQVAMILCYRIPMTYMLLSDTLQESMSLAHLVIQKEPLFYPFLPISLKREWSFITMALKNHSELANCIPEEIRSDYASSLRLVKINSFTFSYLSKILQKSRPIIFAAFTMNWNIVHSECQKSTLYLQSSEIDMLAHLIVLGGEVRAL